MVLDEPHAWLGHGQQRLDGIVLGSAHIWQHVCFPLELQSVHACRRIWYDAGSFAFSFKSHGDDGQLPLVRIYNFHHAKEARKRAEARHRCGFTHRVRIPSARIIMEEEARAANKTR